jgi:hypothetical protein
LYFYHTSIFGRLADGGGVLGDLRYQMLGLLFQHFFFPATYFTPKTRGEGLKKKDRELSFDLGASCL